MVEYPIVVYDAPIWSVYIHVNKINGKKYVGITSQSPQKRWGKNGQNYRPAHGNNNHFYNAICKYKWDNFDHKILAKNITGNQASLFERVLINYYNTLEPYGYNSKNGGQIGTFGTRYSEEYKNKRRGYNSIDALEVICLNTGKRYGSAAEAQRQTNAKSVAHACKSGKCSGKSEDGEPLRWMYIKDYILKTPDELDKIMNREVKTNICKQIICLNTKEVFQSALQALKISTAKSPYGINKTCRNEYKYSGHHYITGEKLRWMYYDDYLKLQRSDINDE